jgi:S-(hydroxymethyl)glutathione dehydrogenase/alcohol dehydrogenase
MRAAVLDEIGGRLRVAELTLDPPKAHEVMIRLASSGVCHTCLHVMQGGVRGVALPTVLGDEGAGVVAAVGPDVTSVRPGDHAVISWAPSCGRCRQCAAGRPALCERRPPQGRLADGTVRIHDGARDVFHFGPATYASEMVVPESCVVPIRADMPLDLASLIGCSVATGVGAVVNTAQVKAGESVAVFGCGGVGLNCVQGARLAGASPIIAVDISPGKLDLAQQFGATHVIDASQDDVVSTLASMTPHGVDIAVVTLGRADVVAHAWAALAPHGACVVVGRMEPGEEIRLDPDGLYGMEKRLLGSRYGSTRPFEDFPQLVDLYLAGKLLLDELVTRRYSLDEADEAHRALEAGELARALLIP